MIDENTETASLPLYKSHKTVRALEISSLAPHAAVDGKYVLTFTDTSYPPMSIAQAMLARYRPVRGDFYVVYEDGYASFSPRKAFVDGYTLVHLVAPLLVAFGVMLGMILAPSPARAEAQVKCAPGLTAAPRHCTAILAQADAMRAVLTNAPPDYPMMQVMLSCIRGLSEQLPGYDYNTYMNSCGHIRIAVTGH